jgi:hypothetical protein
MTTAVVVTTIVSHDSSEAMIVEQLFEQIRANDRDLLNRLAHLGHQARVTSAVVNIADFMSYAQEWLTHRNGEAPPAQTHDNPQTRVCTGDMNEAEFMDHMLAQIREGKAPSYAQFGDDALEAMSEERIGEHWSQHPFLY